MSLINTRLTNFRADSPLDKWEVRASSYGAFDLFRRQSQSPTGIITPELQQKAIAAAGSTLEIPVLDAETFTITNVTQPVTITGGASTSQLYSVSFVNYYFGFRIFPGQHFNNDIGMQREFNRKLQGYVYALLSALDSAALTELENGKTQVLSETLGGNYSLAANVVLGVTGQESKILGDTNVLFMAHDYANLPIDSVGSPSFQSIVNNELVEKGQFNTENKTYQWADKFFQWTPRLTNAANQNGTYFAVLGDSVGMVQQFSPDAVLGHRTHKHIWDMEILPIANIPVGVYQYNDAIDASGISGAATGHLTASKAEFYGFHTAVAMISPYNSDRATIAAPIMKMAVSTV